jgi:hypothetical protein
MTARVPAPGGDNDSWGSVLNDYLQQALAADGTLVTTATNSYTGTTNTNLANSTRPGLVQLAGDLTVPVTAPKVVGLQGNAVSATAPNDGQVLTWDDGAHTWTPTTVTSGGGYGRNISSVSTPTTAGSAASTDYIYLVSGTTTITLPTAVSNTNRYTVTNTGSATITVATTSSQTIEGSSSAAMPISNMSLDFISNGSNWIIQ